MDDNMKQLLQLCDSEFSNWSEPDDECSRYYCKFCTGMTFIEKNMKHDPNCAVLRFQEIKERIVK